MICVNSVSVSPKYITLKAGGWSYAASAAVYPSNADCKGVTWHSNNSSVASVNASNGYIYANGVGTARIYATATDGSGCSDYLIVTVSNTVSVTSVTLDRSAISLEEGQCASLCATVCPDNASNKSLSWISSNNNVATVYNGIVTANGRGSARITATSTDGSGKSDFCTVSVTGDILVTSITVSPSAHTMTVGSSAFLSATVCPINATNCDMIWSSDDPCVAIVDPNSGIVCAQNAGTTVIRATAQDGSGVAGRCNITVTEERFVCVEGITLNDTLLTLHKGSKYALRATVYPTDATTKTIRWSSSDSSVVKVDASSGEVEAVAAGGAYVYATATDGSGVSTGCEIVVTQTVVQSVEEPPEYQDV